MPIINKQTNKKKKENLNSYLNGDVSLGGISEFNKKCFCVTSNLSLLLFNFALMTG